MAKIIGFGHKAQSGKDTAGQHLAMKYGFATVSFAHRLREAASLVTKIPLEEFYGDNKLKFNKLWQMTHREILQRFGTDALRNHFDENVWVKAAMVNLTPLGSYVFTDVRFPNEAGAIKAAGGTVIRIDRKCDDYTIDRNHPSETSLDEWNDWDYIVDNNGTLREFHENLDTIMQELGYYPVRHQAKIYDV